MMVNKLIFFIFVGLAFIITIANGQSSPRFIVDTASCDPSCNWEDDTIWNNGVRPTATDTVDLQLKKNYKVVVNSDVVVANFEIGTDDRSDGSHGFVINSGGSFRSTARVTALLTATVTVNQNATIAGTDLTINGKMILYGTALFNTGSAAVSISTTDKQISTTIIFATLELWNGTMAANSVAVSSTANIYGDGTINGTVNLAGTIEPGFSEKIGNIQINGDLRCTSQTEIHMDIGAAESYDNIKISGQLNQDGNLYANLINKYDPLSYSLYYVLNHTGQVGGFKTIRGSGWTNIFSKSWKARTDQDWTALQFNSASSLFLSFTLFVGCLFVALF